MKMFNRTVNLGKDRTRIIYNILKEARRRLLLGKDHVKKLFLKIIFCLRKAWREP